MRKLIYVIALLGLFSCDKSFEEINTDKFSPTEANPDNLLNGILYNTAEAHTDFNNTISAMMQYTVDIDAGGQYDFRVGPWGQIYAAFTNIADIEAKAAEYPAYMGYAVVGKIVRAHYAAFLTELYIDVPYSEAAKGLDLLIKPKYDTQESIFAAVIADLEEANNLLNSEDLSVQGGDLIYGGDMLKWQKLANSLRLRYLLKVSKVMPEAAVKMQEIISNPDSNPVFESNEDNALLDYTGVYPFNGPYDALASSYFEIIAASEYYVNLLSVSNDPRLDYFFSLPLSDDINFHQGVPAGLSGEDFADKFPDGKNGMSLLNRRFNENKGQIDYAMMTYTELQFILAEAALKGMINGDAEDFYNNAVNSSFEYWKLEAPENFFSMENVAWDGTMETLINQKWAAGFHVFNLEVWSDQKRTGLPDFDLPAMTFPSTNGQIPTRMIYPVMEQSLNKANYDKAVQSIGGDNSLAPHWYQAD